MLPNILIVLELNVSKPFVVWYEQMKNHTELNLDRIANDVAIPSSSL